jgi:hypothetical protein
VSYLLISETVTILSSGPKLQPVEEVTLLKAKRDLIILNYLLLNSSFSERQQKSNSDLFSGKNIYFVPLGHT